MNILLTSSGRRSYIVKYFKDALGKKGLVYASNPYWSPALQVADKAVISPFAYDAIYTDFLLDYALKHKITAIISLFDVELPVLAVVKSKFKKFGIDIIVSEPEAIKICNDKVETHSFLVKHNFPSPKTYLSRPDALDALKKKEVKFPVIIKPRWGMGSIGVYSADNECEMEIFYLKAKREVLKTCLKYESEADINHSVIIQEQLAGKEYGLDIVNDLKKRYVVTFVKHKTVMRAGETDSAITEDNLMLRNLGREISLHLRHIAMLDVDCFVANGKPYVVDMNCRFGGGYPFSHLAGANIPLAIIKWLKGENPSLDLFQIKYNVKAIKDIQPVILKSDE